MHFRRAISITPFTIAESRISKSGVLVRRFDRSSGRSRHVAGRIRAARPALAAVSPEGQVLRRRDAMLHRLTSPLDVQTRRMSGASKLPYKKNSRDRTSKPNPAKVSHTLMPVRPRNARTLGEWYRRSAEAPQGEIGACSPYGPAARSRAMRKSSAASTAGPAT